MKEEPTEQPEINPQGNNSIQEDATLESASNEEGGEIQESELERLRREEGDETLLALIAKGRTYDTDIDEAEERGYIRGCNDNIDNLTEKGVEGIVPEADDPLADNCMILNHIRQSIWDI